MAFNLDLEPLITKAVEKTISDFALESKIEEALRKLTINTPRVIEVSLPDNSKIKMGIQHFQFEAILKLIAMGENVMIKGEAGNGKSHVVSQCAKALGLEFHSLSVSNQTTKTDLIGFVDAHGVYRYNGFIKAFRDGGIFNMDEIDAGNANVLVVLNSALSNGFIETPAGDMIYAHENFRFTATANTVGRGANQRYIGRNKLDMATLDRFAVIEFTLDSTIEKMLCENNENFHNALIKIREYCERNYEDLLISQRSSTRLYKLLKNGFSVEDAIEIAVLKGADKDISESVIREFKKYYKGKIKTETKTEIKTEIKTETKTETKTEIEENFEKFEPKENPKCPRCGAPMTLKEAKTGFNKGNKFWGCTKFNESHCDGIRKYEENEDPFDF